MLKMVFNHREEALEISILQKNMCVFSVINIYKFESLLRKKALRNDCSN